MNSAVIEKPVTGSISPAQVQSFLKEGLVRLPGALNGPELLALQESAATLIESAHGENQNHPDFKFSTGTQSGARVFKRIDYVVDKSEAFRHLLAHPFILNSVEKLQGPNFIPTWDAMVVKMPGESAVVPWHRDAAAELAPPHLPPVFNVDIYLDPARGENCLWVIPGSHAWSAEEAVRRISRPGFDTTDAVAVPVEAGDVILHNIRLLHGSAAGKGNSLRRTIYYEFRPAETELALGPHTEEYIPLKQRALSECIAQRSNAFLPEGEAPFIYRPTGRFTVPEGQAPAAFRFPHEKFWRASATA